MSHILQVGVSKNNKSQRFLTGFCRNSTTAYSICRTDYYLVRGAGAGAGVGSATGSTVAGVAGVAVAETAVAQQVDSTRHSRRTTR